MNCILVFLIFSGVVSAVSGKLRSCNTCEVVGEEETNCVGKKQQCENETDFCITQIEKNKLGDVKTTIKKRCMKAEDRKLCDQIMTLNTTKLDILLYSKCCFDTDCCNSEGIEMPKINNTHNGFKCDACFAEGSYKCTDKTVKDCVGNQKQCFSFKGKGARPEDSFKKYKFEGCVTEHACLFNLDDLPGTRIGKVATYNCTTPSE